METFNQPQRLKLFYCKASGDFVGGMCLVAANTKLEAYGVLCSHLAHEDCADIIRDYDIDDFTEIENCSIERPEPCFIAESSYKE